MSIYKIVRYKNITVNGFYVKEKADEMRELRRLRDLSKP